jgi:hypothetical protein
MPSSETNNTAEYTAMLLGIESALRHGADRLLIEGDSHLALSQVRGTFACTNRRLRRLRNRVRTGLARLAWHRLAHIDRKANAHADRLANRALDAKKTLVECATHDVRMLDACTTAPSTLRPGRDLAGCDTEATAAVPRRAALISAADLDDAMDEEADIAARDHGEVFPTVPIGPGSAPARQPRLRLRQLDDAEHEAAGAAVEALATTLTSKIADADDWETGEGYISAIPTRLRDVLRPYTLVPIQRIGGQPARPHQAQHQSPQQRQRGHQQQRQTRPPRVTRHAREHRLDEALDDLEAVQRADSSDHRRVRTARRRVGRLRAAQEQSDLRQLFARDEKRCVERILRAAAPDADVPAPTAPETCPIDRETLFQHFTGTNAPHTRFDFNAPAGAAFREALAALPPATEAMDALADTLTVDEVEDQLRRTAAASSPGHDGIGYDVYRRFAKELVPMLHAAFQFCWEHGRVPALWKVGVVRLIWKKGSPEEPSNWRPICLQPAIYKIYSGLLARRLSTWMEANARLPDAQKGFRAFNGCHEHNFVATSLLDQARRLHRRLYAVWYDLRNAFGSLPQDMMWLVLRHLGVDARFIARCRAIYHDSFFVVGAADGPTDPVRQEVGVYQGCPLSPLLFIAATAPLLHALERLDGVGVTLADGVRPCATAYADDIKVFADTADGIRRCHRVVVDFLAWTGLRANPAKCAMLAVTRNARGNPVHDETLSLELHGEAVAPLKLHESYAYLGVGDGFDHVRHRLQLEPKLRRLKQETIALLRSGLAPWQIVKAIKVYVYPKVEYALRHLRPFQSQLQGFDSALKRGLRHLLRLPASATNEFFFSPASCGGLGLLPLTELHEALQLGHAWQMLQSKDANIRAIALHVGCRPLAGCRARGGARAALPERQAGGFGVRHQEAPQWRHLVTLDGRPAASADARPGL